MNKFIKLLLCLLTFFYIGSCVDDFELVQSPIPSVGKYKPKSIIPSVLDSLRGDSLFYEMVRLSNRSKFYHDYDSVKLLCGDDMQLFDSLYRKHNDALLSDALTYYRNHRRDYRQDFLYYVLYESNRPILNQSRSVDVDDVIVELLTPEYIWKTMESLRSQLVNYSHYIYDDYIKFIECPHTSSCGCRIDIYYIIMSTFEAVARSSIPYAIPYIELCLEFSDYLSHPISLSAIENDIYRISSELRSIGGIHNLNSRITDELMAIADYSPVFREYVIYDLTCTVYPSSGGGGGNVNPPTPCIYCGQTNCSGACQQCNHLICPICKKYISRTRSSSVCDSHIYCENNGNCIEIGLTVSKREVDISDVYNIIADITTSNLSGISDVSLEIQTYNSTMWIQLNNNASNNQMGMINKTKSSDGKRYTFERRAITGGECRIRTRVDRGNDHYYSNEVSVIEKAPSRAIILANNGVKSHFESLWINTLDFARNSSNNEVKEYGCVVLINPLTGEYLFDDCEGTPVRVDANFNQANIIHTIYTYNRTPNSFNPIEVAIFHTHPPLTYGDRSFTEFIPSGPSVPDDIENARTLRIPGFVWCYFASIDVYHKINDPNGIVEYGYERREF